MPAIARRRSGLGSGGYTRSTGGGARARTSPNLESRLEKAAALRTFTLHYGQAQVWRAMHEERYEIVSVFAGTGAGKALALDTPIPTPTGWTTMGALAVGDKVLDEQGQPCLVTFATPIQYDHTCYEVVFSDGSVITADADHRWHTWTYSERKAAGRRITRPAKRARSPQTTPRHPAGAVRTTAEIANRLTHTCGQTPRANHAIPVAHALELPTRALPVDPYVLGVWLGDGHAREATLTCNDPEILTEVEAAGYATRKHKAPYMYGLGASDRWRDATTGQWRCDNGLHGALKALGVLGDKHVPSVYLRASAAQRQALLAGLMDTDGTVDSDGGCVFTNTNPRLADAVEELVVSLGYQARRTTKRGRFNGQEHALVYVVAFTPSGPVFRLPRKLARQRLGDVRATQRWRYIVDARLVTSVPVRCITVDSPSHLYLAGRAMIPTHNTWLGPRLWYPRIRENLDKYFLFVEPTWQMLKRIMLPEVVPFLDSFGLGEMHLGDMVYYLHGGGAILFGSVNNPNSLQGKHIDGGIWADEVGLYSEDAYDVLEQRRALHRPPQLNTSTPYTLPWCERRLAVPARAGHRDSGTYKLIQFPSYWNPKYSKEEYFRLKRTWPADKFNRLMRGEFTRVNGLCFDSFNEDDNLATIYDAWPERRLVYFKHPREGERWVRVASAWASMDWGWTDAGCLSLFVQDERGSVYLVRQEYDSLVPFIAAEGANSGDTWTSRLLAWHRRWGLEGVFCGHDRPENIKVWRDLGLPAVAAITGHAQGFDAVNQACLKRADGRMGLYIAGNNCTDLVRTIGSYVKAKAPGSDDYLEKAAPGQEDHSADSLRYGVIKDALPNKPAGPRDLPPMILPGRRRDRR